MIPIAYPYIPSKAKEYVAETLSGRWIGQGPKVKAFEEKFQEMFHVEHAIAVNSGTGALELAYDLLGVGPGDEVISPVLTCTATNLPIIRRGATLVFADIKHNLTVDSEDIRKKITHKTKAVVVVDLHGIRADRGPFYRPDGKKIPLIVDAAQALGNFSNNPVEWPDDIICCSFQAIKHITTGDGGMLVTFNPEIAKEAKLRRWFGIDREKKIGNNWQPYKQRELLFDIEYPGYKLHMNDIAASMGLAGLESYHKIMSFREQIWNIYKGQGLPLVDGPDNKYGYACMLVDDREKFAEGMAKEGIETNVMQVRNDIYSVFKPFASAVPTMDSLDEHYICIPMHNKLRLKDADFIAKTARKLL